MGHRNRRRNARPSTKMSSHAAAQRARRETDQKRQKELEEQWFKRYDERSLATNVEWLDIARCYSLQLRNASHLSRVHTDTDHPRTGPHHRATKQVANCQDNPFCLVGLVGHILSSRTQSFARAHQLTAVTDADYSAATAECDAELDVVLRDPHETPAGLRNRGATCYMNSLLQTLFWDQTFRADILAYAPACASTELDVIAALQNLFVEMSHSHEAAVDPKEFVEALGLDSSIQQDPQEFANLFLSKVEEGLRSAECADVYQSAHAISSLVQDTFEGKVGYVDQCDKCGHIVSLPQEAFSDIKLPLGGSNVELKETLLEDLLTNVFVESETLEGKHCDRCKQAHDHTRRTRLAALPRIVNLSILRFDFDPSTMQKKKVKTKIKVPTKLDMAPYVQLEQRINSSQDSSALIYELVGVLMHKGDSANAGHYVAHIKTSLGDRTSKWMTFDDQSVTPMNPGDWGDGAHDRVDINKCRFLWTSDAYLCVYRQRGVNPELPDGQKLEQHLELMGLLKPVEENNSVLLSQKAELEANRLIRCETEARELKRWYSFSYAYADVFFSAPSSLQNLLDEYVFVAVDQLVAWARRRTATSSPGFEVGVEVVTRQQVCPHNRLPISAVTEGVVKVVPREVLVAAGADFGLECGTSGASLKDLLCPDCVIVTALNQQTRISSDEFRLSTARSLKEQTIPSDKWKGSSDANARWISWAFCKAIDAKSFEQNEATVCLCSGVLCEHGKLRPSVLAEKDRRIVKVPIWSEAQQYAPRCLFATALSSAQNNGDGYAAMAADMRCVPIEASTPVCEQCQQSHIEEHRRSVNRDKLAERIRTDLRCLFKTRQHRMCNLESGETIVLLPNLWLEAAGKFAKPGATDVFSESTLRTSLEGLLCSHGRLKYDPYWELEQRPAVRTNPPPDISVRQRFVRTRNNTLNLYPCSQSDWEAIVDIAWAIEKEWMQGGEDMSVGSDDLVPIHCKLQDNHISQLSVDVCDECVAAREQSEWSEDCSYTNALLTIKCQNGVVDRSPRKGVSGGADAHGSEEPWLTAGHSRNQAFTYGSRELRSGTARRGTFRTEELPGVQANWTLSGLKLQLSALFDIPPMSQRLFLFCDDALESDERGCERAALRSSELAELCNNSLNHDPSCSLRFFELPSSIDDWTLSQCGIVNRDSLVLQRLSGDGASDDFERQMQLALAASVRSAEDTKTDSDRLDEATLRVHCNLDEDTLRIIQAAGEAPTTASRGVERGFAGSRLVGNGRLPEPTNVNASELVTPKAHAESPAEADVWACKQCTFINEDATAVVCAVCEQRKA